MLGRISSQSETQIRIRTQFFDEIIIPLAKLPAGTLFKREEQLMVWRTVDEENGEQELFFDNHETVRFRIEEEVWTDLTPVGPKEKEENAGLSSLFTAVFDFVVMRGEKGG